MEGTNIFKLLRNYLSPIAGCSVTQRIKQIQQPWGGLIQPKTMTKTQLGKGIEELAPEENISAALVGMTVDYLTRFMSGDSVEEAFRISFEGAKLIKKQRTAQKIAKQISGLDDISITAAVKLSGFDVCFRAGIGAYVPVETIDPNSATLNNIRIMVERSLFFLYEYGPKVLDGLTFEGGYTELINSGDGDFLTKDTLWDFKVSKSRPQKNHTLQLLIYWRMGLHSCHKEYQKVKYLGIYNPRLNIVYRIGTNEISDEVIEYAEKEIIGYR